MADWNADLYRQFEEERTRPARELLDRVNLDAPGEVIDLGCGPGNSTELLLARYPAAQVLGLDTSDDMLASARKRLLACRFIKADIASWQPQQAPDLLYANAALQWVPDHVRLFPRLTSLLASNGMLAVQMPDNLDEPTHRLMREVAATGPWAPLIGDAGAKRAKCLQAADYYDLLAPQARDIDIWRTTYYHLMPSAAAIVSWLRATGLKPFVDPLPAAMQVDFLAAYQARIDAAYPPHADGKRLLAFPRLFLTARRNS
jgi:trans-aconitate 2-methyltransferase